MSTSYDSDLIEHLKHERKEIVSKYDKGCDESDRLPTMEPEKIDRYGFISNTEPAYDDDAHKKSRRRELKWSVMLSNWSLYYGSEKLIQRVYKGIPDSFRSIVWSRLLDIEVVKSDQLGVYEQMRERARSSSPDIRQIDLDVNRTFRENIYFRDRFNYRQQMLFHVLAAYSVYNTEIGYCQGMNNIAALLLMYFEGEENAFWGLSQLMTNQKWAMHGFFISKFPKFTRFDGYFDRILRRLLPKVKRHLDFLAVSSTMYLFKWFINCFIDVLPFSLVLRIWDIYLNDGEKILLGMAYTILRIHRHTIVHMKSIDAVLQFFGSSLSQDFGISDDEAIAKLSYSLEELDRNNLLPPPGPPPDEERPHKPFAPDMIPPTDEILKRANRNRIEESLIRHVPSSLTLADDDIESIIDASNYPPFYSDNTDTESLSYNSGDVSGTEIGTLRRYPSVYDNVSKMRLSRNIMTSKEYASDDEVQSQTRETSKAEMNSVGCETVNQTETNGKRFTEINFPRNGTFHSKKSIRRLVDHNFKIPIETRRLFESIKETKKNIEMSKFKINEMLPLSSRSDRLKHSKFFDSLSTHKTQYF